MTYRWWEHFKDRYYEELRRLTEAGITHRPDPAAYARGILRLHLETQFKNKQLKLCATFPDLYPFFRFEIQVFSWNLPHHQDPIFKHICLFQASTWNWRPADDFLADFITSRVADVWETAHAKETPPSTIEEPQAEPATVHFLPYASGGVLVDECWSFDIRDGCGNLLLGSMVAPATIAGPLAVLEVSSNAGAALSSAEPPINTLFHELTIQGRWVYVDHPPFDAMRKHPPGVAAVEALFEFARSKDSGARVAFMGLTGGAELYAIIFPDERSQRGLSTGFGWIFVSHPKRVAAANRQKPKIGGMRTHR